MFEQYNIHRDRDTSRVWKRFGDIAEKVSQLIMLGSAELLVGDQTVLVLVLVGKDLLHQLVLVLHHLASLLALFSSGVLHRLHLLLQVAADLVPAERDGNKSSAHTLLNPTAEPQLSPSKAPLML